MNRLMTLLVLLALLGGGACFGFPSSEEAGVSYATSPIDWPENAPCLNEETPELAKEIIIGSTSTVVVSGGDNEISDEAWERYWPSLGNQKNSNRNLEFKESCFWRSPSSPRDCEGGECQVIVEADGYTWVELAQITAADCVPAEAGCQPFSVGSGELAFIVTKKCHEVVFRDKVIELVGPGGERAVMHATADGTPDLSVALPAGWSFEEHSLADPLVLHPFGTGDECFYNIIRDAKEQAYHQYEYAGAFYP